MFALYRRYLAISIRAQLVYRATFVMKTIAFALVALGRWLLGRGMRRLVVQGG